MQIRGSRQSVKTRQNCIFDYKKLILGNWKQKPAFKPASILQHIKIKIT
jgi:hypothetical protein